jgi:hypothetical protein
MAARLKVFHPCKLSPIRRLKARFTDPYRGL